MPARGSLSLRIFLVHLLFVCLSGYFVLATVMDEIRPGVRQSTEETLVDTANLLAEILRDDVKAGTLDRSRYQQLLTAYGQRHPQADIWGIRKTDVNHRIYVTDRNGIVLLDSQNKAVGQDYSRWNDVYLTLRGRYGARTTRDVPTDEDSTVMHVAAPILDGKQVIGVVTVAKPNRSMQPYIERTQRRLGWIGGGLIVLGVAAGALLAWWLSSSIRKLTRYAQAVSAGERAALPQSPSGELSQLAAALESMRVQLEGKEYVERYVQTLTHELKSPLAGIRGAAELLRQDMPVAQRAHFLGNVENEALRMQNLIERLLNLAQVEQRRHLDERAEIALHSLVREIVSAQSGRIQANEVDMDNAVPEECVVRGERFLLGQALSNLLDNALDFTPRGGRIRMAALRVADSWLISVRNQGEPIPDFALPRVTERFYSLPRPITGRKSTGLGLNFVKEVAALHQGSLGLHNVDDGVEVQLTLPAA